MTHLFLIVYDQNLPILIKLCVYLQKLLLGVNTYLQINCVVRRVTNITVFGVDCDHLFCVCIELDCITLHTISTESR